MSGGVLAYDPDTSVQSLGDDTGGLAMRRFRLSGSESKLRCRENLHEGCSAFHSTLLEPQPESV